MFSGRAGAKAPFGGVLSDRAITGLVNSGQLIVENFDPDSLQPASYDLKVAPDGLISPSVERPPGSNDHPSTIVLASGETAVFSTVERFRMPLNVAGNITIKNRLAIRGLMLFSGLLIDPGYGQRGNAEDRGGGSRLHIHVANIGREPIEIRTNKDRIARIQFLSVVGGHDQSTNAVEASKWRDQERPSLGFLTDLKQLKDSSERNRDLISFVLIGGIFVLLMTMISVSLAVILSLSSDGKLVIAARAAVPQSTSGKWLEAALIFGLTVLALTFGMALLLRIRSDRSRRRY